VLLKIKRQIEPFGIHRLILNAKGPVIHSFRVRSPFLHFTSQLLVNHMEV